MIEKILERLEELYSMNEKTKKTAYEDQDWEKFELFMHRNEGVYLAIQMVQEVAKEYGKGWIPVEVELPNEDERVLCFHSHGFADCGVLIGKTWCCDMDDYAIKRDNVIAWKPIAPYQKGE